MFAEAIFPLMAAYVCIDSHLQGCARARACVPARPAALRVGAPGARCQPQQKEVSALSAGGLRWQLPPPRLQPHAPSILPLIHISILLRQLLSSPPLLLFPNRGVP